MLSNTNFTQFFTVALNSTLHITRIKKIHIQNFNIARNLNSMVVTMLISAPCGVISKTEVYIVQYLQLSVIVHSSVHFCTLSVLIWQIL